MILNPIRLVRALATGAVAGVLVAKDVLTATPPPETMVCPICGEEHEVTRLEGMGLPVVLCKEVPEGLPRLVPSMPYTPN